MINRILNFFRNGKKTPQIKLSGFGNWEIENNPPYGFVIKNKLNPEEYHFFSESNGWITSRNLNRKNTAGFAYNSALENVAGGPLLVDKVSTAKMEKIKELQGKKELTKEEKDELLSLTGLRKKK